MGVEKSMIFRGITIPRLYGTLSQSTIMVNKINNQYTINYNVIWYIIEQENGHDAISSEFFRSDSYSVTMSGPLGQDIYVICYDDLKSRDSSIKDYLDPMPFLNSN